MAAKQWVAEFYPNIPSKDDEPLHTIEVKAENAQAASTRAGLVAFDQGIHTSYMIVKAKP